MLNKVTLPTSAYGTLFLFKDIPINALLRGGRVVTSVKDPEPDPVGSVIIGLHGSGSVIVRLPWSWSESKIFLKWRRLFHKIRRRIVPPASLCTVLERGVFTLYCTQSPPTPLYRGGRFDYRFYYILYDNTINCVAMSLYFYFHLFYCVLCGCCVCSCFERVSVHSVGLG